MIPIHDLPALKANPIRIHQLHELTSYDFGEPHRHGYFEFFVFEKGGGHHMIDFVDFPIEAGAIHLVAPGQVHQVKRELNSKGHVILFETAAFAPDHFVTNFLYDHICLGVEEFPPVYNGFDEDARRSVFQMMDEAWKDYRSSSPLKNELVLSQLTILLIHCMRLRGGTSAREIPKQQRTYAEFRRLLKNNFRAIRKVKEYAKALAVSEKQLNDIIQARTGLSASAVIYRQVILEAQRLLKTGMSAKETAFELNFDDPAHFSKFFKTQTGISPGDFQKVQD